MKHCRVDHYEVTNYLSLHTKKINQMVEETVRMKTGRHQDVLKDNVAVETAGFLQSLLCTDAA